MTKIERIRDKCLRSLPKKVKTSSQKKFDCSILYYTTNKKGRQLSLSPALLADSLSVADKMVWHRCKYNQRLSIPFITPTPKPLITFFVIFALKIHKQSFLCRLSPLKNHIHISLIHAFRALPAFIRAF
ncbi:MAG: hypothetical protein IPP77_00675 [Bacteroidetes bacterium]|nr:hypothetical protein [Bacteroidota bacterium]